MLDVLNCFLVKCVTIIEVNSLYSAGSSFRTVVQGRIFPGKVPNMSEEGHERDGPHQLYRFIVLMLWDRYWSTYLTAYGVGRLEHVRGSVSQPLI